MKCQGSCCVKNKIEDQPEVALYRVYMHTKVDRENWGFWPYCPEAVEVDKDRGFHVDNVNSNECCWESFRAGKQTCKCDDEVKS